MRLPQINIGTVRFQPELWQAGAIVFLLFLLVLTVAQMRRHYLNWSVRGATFGIFIGFMLALVLEGFLLLSGRTFLTTILGWKTAPMPIQDALSAGNDKLKQVIGVSTSTPPCPSR